MLLERSYLIAREGKGDAFAQELEQKAAPLLKATAGVRSVQWGRGVESPSKFILLVEWNDMAAHQAFTRHESFAELRNTLAAFSAGGEMEHFEMR